MFTHGLKTLLIGAACVLALGGCRRGGGGDGDDGGTESQGATDDAGDAADDNGDDDGSDSSGGPPLPADIKPFMMISSRRQLVWKRYAALEQDLMRALELEQNELCSELDLVACVPVHLVPLGGSNPLGRSMYERPPETLSTTPIAVDRLVLAACSNRATVDADPSTEDGEPQVFTHFDLAAQSLDLDDADVSEAVDDHLTMLFRRFLARNPNSDELVVLRKLTVDASDDPVSALDFAKLSCFTVATTTEALFF